MTPLARFHSTQPLTVHLNTTNMVILGPRRMPRTLAIAIWRAESSRSQASPARSKQQACCSSMWARCTMPLLRHSGILHAVQRVCDVVHPHHDARGSAKSETVSLRHVELRARSVPLDVQ